MIRCRNAGVLLAILTLSAGCAAVPQDYAANVILKKEPPKPVRVLTWISGGIPEYDTVISEGRSSFVVVPKTVPVRWKWDASVDPFTGHQFYMGLQMGVWTSTNRLGPQLRFTNSLPLGSPRLYAAVAATNQYGDISKLSNIAPWPKLARTNVVLSWQSSRATIYSSPVAKGSLWTLLTNVIGTNVTLPLSLVGNRFYGAGTNRLTLVLQ